jgi:hypothetical protein
MMFLRTLLKGPKGHHVGDSTLLLDYSIRCETFEDWAIIIFTLLY